MTTTLVMNAKELGDTAGQHYGRVVSFDNGDGGLVRGELFSTVQEAWETVIVVDTYDDRELYRVRSFATQVTVEDKGATPANESTEAHPGLPVGPWRHFEDCPECGTHRGYPCVDISAGQQPGKLLGHAHTSRVLVWPPAEARNAAALEDVAALRRAARNPLVNKSTSDVLDRLDRIEQALRGES